MDIRVAQRFRPYSHKPGTRVVVPGTTLRLEVFPSLLRVHSVETRIPHLVSEIDLDVTGPVEKFTVCLDLEKGRVRVWGHAQNGYYRYAVSAKENSVALLVERAPEHGLNVESGGSVRCLQIGEELSLTSTAADIPIHRGLFDSQERLSLGCNKAANWERVSERLNMSEITPFWLRYGAFVSPDFWRCGGGTAAQLPKFAELLVDKAHTHVEDHIRSLFLQGFDGLLAPRLVDTDHHGFVNPPVHDDDSPMALLSMGARLLRQLFIQEFDKYHVDVLPVLPPSWHCGRFINIACGTESRLSIEWTKKTLRRMVLRCEDSTEWTFSFPHSLKSFRLRRGTKDSGRSLDTSKPIKLDAGYQYFFDNFQS